MCVMQFKNNNNYYYSKKERCVQNASGLSSVYVVSVCKLTPSRFIFLDSFLKTNLLLKYRAPSYNTCLLKILKKFRP